MKARAWEVLRCIVLQTIVLSSLGCLASREPTIAVIPETTAQEIWESEHAGVEQAARLLHWKIYWNAPSREDDVTRQIQLVNHTIANGAKGLILAPDHAFALISPVRSAVAHNIPVVIVSSPLAMSPTPQVAFVLNDEISVGRLAAARAVLKVTPTDAISVLGVNPNILGSIARTNAFEATVHKRFPGLTITEKHEALYGFAEAVEVTENVISSVPRLRVIFSLNVNQTRAAYQALLNTGNLEHIKLIGCDQDLDLVHHVRYGGIDALIAENTYQMGLDAIRRLQEQMRGQSTTILTFEEPVLVTKQNVDSAAVQRVLDMDWTKAEP